MSGSGMPDGPLVVVVTGASAGIGRITCERLAKSNHRLVLAARSADKLQLLHQQLAAQGVQSLAVPADVADPGAIERLVSRTVDHFGRIDVLINNAGIECFAALDEATEEQVLQTIETNLTGAILLTRRVIPVMKRQKFGRIINISSVAGKHGPAYGAVYGATKAALIALTQSLRGELMSEGISSTVICPGFATNGGIYDEIVRLTGKQAPSLLGGTTAEKVAVAIEKAIRTAPPEIILNFPYLRPVFLFRDLFPRLGEQLFLAVTRKFLKRIAEYHRPK